MPSPLQLVQRYLHDGILGRDTSVFDHLLAVDYRFETGGFVISGRDDYRSMVDAYLIMEPTVGVTVHDVFTDGRHVAVHMTKHTTRPATAWEAVLLYVADGERLTGCWSEQDWTAYHRHRAGERPPEVGPPDHDPWAVPAMERDEETDALATAWLRAGGYGATLDDPEVTVNCSFSAARRVAFHVTERGTYRHGLEGGEAFVGAPAENHVAGTAIVMGGRVADVCTVTDRTGLARRLAAARI